MTTLKGRDLMPALRGLRALGAELLPARMAMVVFRLQRTIQPLAEKHEEQRTKIVREYGVKVANGYVLDGSDRAAAGKRKIDDLDALGHEVEGGIPLAELETEFGDEPPAGYANILHDLGPLLSESQASPQEKRRAARKTGRR